MFVFFKYHFHLNTIVRKKYSLFSFILLVIFLPIKTQNLLKNGDFESGGKGIGFDVNSIFHNQLTPPYSENTSNVNYPIASNPQTVNNGFVSGGDHTSGTGKMLIVEGTSTVGSQRFWRAGSNGGGICNLTIGITYIFSYSTKLPEKVSQSHRYF